MISPLLYNVSTAFLYSFEILVCLYISYIMLRYHLKSSLITSYYVYGSSLIQRLQDLSSTDYGN